MKLKIIFLFMLISGATFAQNGTIERAVLELVKQGLEEDKLPGQLINDEDYINYPANLIAIERTNVNKLESGYNIRYGDVDMYILTKEEIFTYNPYYLIPLKIEVKNDKLTFEFTTDHNEKDNRQFYTGSITGKLEDGNWVLKKCKMEKKKGA